jgi:WD40 repeat protein/serine/threonine protein kinase
MSAYKSQSEPPSQELSTRLEEFVHRFEDAWQSGRRPHIDDYLPPPGPDRSKVLVELVHVDLERRLKAGEAVRVEQYLESCPELAVDQGVVLNLLASEFALRRRGEPELSREDYRRRFPALGESLLAHIGTDQSLSSPPASTIAENPTVLPPGDGDRETGAASERTETSRAWPTVPGYEILGELGRGGMGVVYKARQAKLNRLVALKMILAGEHAGPEQLARFRREAEAVARLQHPHFVHIYEVGEQDGQPYFSLEFVDGANLAQKLNGTPLPAQQAAELVETLARAIHHAHLHGIIHRDLKPANILLEESSISRPDTAIRQGSAADTFPHHNSWLLNSIPKITDFGLAKRLDVEAAQTQTGAIMGTPSYMAPEQAEGKNKKIGPAADIYALGAILYELLTGRPPFKAATPLDTVLQVMSEEPISPRRLQPKVPRDLETICFKCLEKEPGKRYASAFDLAEDLRRFVKGEPICARPIGVPARFARWCGRNPVVASLSTAVLLLLLLVAVTASAGYLQTTKALRSVAERNRAAVAAKDDAERASNEAQLAKAAAEKTSRELEAALKEAKRKSAVLALERGLALCNEGQVSLGMHWLARSLHDAPVDDLALQRAIRGNLSNWLCRLHPLKAMIPHPRAFGGVAHSPDGKTVVSTTGKAVQVWDATSGKPVGTPLSFLWGVMALSRDGKAVLTDGVFRASLIEVPTGKQLGLVPCVGVNAAAISPNGKTIAVGSSNKVLLWDVAACKFLGPTLQHQGTVRAVVFGPGGNAVLTHTQDGTARLWDITTGKAIGPLMQCPPLTLSAAFNPDGKTVLLQTQDGVAQLWDLATNKAVGPSMRHPISVTAAAFSPDGKMILTGAVDNTARFWDVATGNVTGPVLMQKAEVYAVAFSPDGKIALTGSWDQTARLWDVATRKPLGAPLFHESPVLRVAFSPDGKTGLTETRFGTARLWDVAKTDPLKLPLPGGGGVRAFSADGRIAVRFDTKDRVRLWDIAEGKALGPSLPFEGTVTVLAISPDARVVLFNDGDKSARLWEVKTGRQVGPALQHPSIITAGAFSPDGKAVLTGCLDGKVELRLVRTGQRLGPTLQLPDLVSCLAYSPDGKRVLIACNANMARIWDPATGKLVGPPLRHRGGVRAVAFSPNGRAALTGSLDATARLWEVSTGKPLGPPMEHEHQVYKVGFSGDGTTILTFCADDRVARLWEASTGKPLGPTLPHQGDGLNLAFRPDGNVLFIDKTMAARVWEVKPPWQDSVDRIRLRLSFLTGFELDENDTVQCLDGETWQKHRLRLQSLGDPAPAAETTGKNTGRESPEGKRIASESDDKTVKARDPQTQADNKSDATPLQVPPDRIMSIRKDHSLLMGQSRVMASWPANWSKKKKEFRFLLTSSWDKALGLVPLQHADEFRFLPTVPSQSG